MPDTVLDAKGLICPLPVLRARKAIKSLSPGEILEIHATDPASRLDVPHFCDATGNELLDMRKEGDVLIFRIRKAERGAA
ncbi:MAG TPA: sulfurtransferase TusA family protein [Methylomirabilota bacterium]|jgi:tRNA 2-thiouridine synthesizing protein A|nr:sulfurtransferase TusA family protein [Methylomirabilota bacterium]